MTKTALITGTSYGLGKELAKSFACERYHIVGLGRTPQDKLDHAHVHDYYQCDLGSEASIDKFLTEFENNYSKLDLLVHNAGIQLHYHVAKTQDYYDQLKHEHQVNFLSPVKLTQSLLPLMLKGPSQIMVVTSLLQVGPKPGAPGYCSSKAALANWTANLRAQLKTTPVKVTEIIPGLIKTNMTERAMEIGKAPELLAAYIAKHKEQEQIILPGAKLGWRVAQHFPAFIRHKLINGSD